MDKKEQLKKIKKTVDNYNSSYLSADLGYKFRTRDFLNVVFLYKNKVSVSQPDILGKNTKNTQTNDIEAVVEKIKEQVRLDLKDMNFIVHNASSLSRFVVKAANRKMLKDNNFAEIIDRVPDNAVDFGSGFLKVWKVDKKLKMKSIDPYYMTFNQYDFAKGIKVEKFRKSIRDIIKDEKYESTERTLLSKKYKEEDWDDELVLQQGVQDFPDGTQRITVVDLENDLTFYDYTTKGGEEKIVYYFKYDYEKRAGFPDALGIGCYEKVFNKLVQSKVNRERMDAVLEVAAKLPFQKKMDNERDNWAGKEVVKLETSAILGYKVNPIEPLDTGGIKQVQLIQSQLDSIITSVGPDLNVSEALLGKTLPSGTSGVLGNLLTENSSTVFKDKQEDYAKVLNVVYTEVGTPYLLGVFDSNDDLRKYLDPNDIRVIERGVINYMVAEMQVDAAINGENFSRPMAEQVAKEELKKSKKLISGALLDKLREEVKGIETYISGENFSKAQAVAFLRELRGVYATNPQLLRDPVFVEMIKKEAEFDSGISGVEIDQLLEKMEEQAAQVTPTE